METVKRMIDDAIFHLVAAEARMGHRDESIICDHAKDALVSLKIARRELWNHTGEKRCSSCNMPKGSHIYGCPRSY